MLGGARLRRPSRGALWPERVATALYRGILGREPDLPGLAAKAQALQSGDTLERVIETFIGSPEFRSRFLGAVVPPFELPDLTALMPERYERQPVNGALWNVYAGRDDADMSAMAALIEQHRFYDRFGVWSPVIDLDKQITAAIVTGLGARNCFELGCFTGPVLSLLAEAGISVAGADVSHLAFAFAYPNIRGSMLYGDLLNLELDRTFDVVLCMDVLEHLDPLLLDAHIEKLASILDGDGFLYLNAPMWGPDRVFGLFEEPYLEEWHAVGDAACWRHWPCDERGWPLHGHLVWASSPWWERTFARHGLIRDTVIERAVHRVLGPFFGHAIGRRCLFVLRRPDNRSPSDAVAARVASAIAQVPGLPA
jgi:SAM-dependent methyltransferase